MGRIVLVAACLDSCGGLRRFTCGIQLCTARSFPVRDTVMAQIACRAWFDSIPTGDNAVPSKRSKAKEHIHYHKDGTIWAKGQMTEGVMTGYWEWFRKDGTIMRSGYFENGKQVGQWTTYAKNGKIVKVTTMKPKTK